MSRLWQFLNEPLALAFMQHAFLAIILVGIISGVVGTLVTLRGLAFMGDALGSYMTRIAARIVSGG